MTVKNFATLKIEQMNLKFYNLICHREFEQINKLYCLSDKFMNGQYIRFSKKFGEISSEIKHIFLKSDMIL